jgi:hypothetical protein
MAVKCFADRADQENRVAVRQGIMSYFMFNCLFLFGWRIYVVKPEPALWGYPSGTALDFNPGPLETYLGPVAARVSGRPN